MDANAVIREIEEGQKKENVPEFSVGDTVRVSAKIVEGQRERIQVFEGTVSRSASSQTASALRRHGPCTALRSSRSRLSAAVRSEERSSITCVTGSARAQRSRKRSEAKSFLFNRAFWGSRLRLPLPVYILYSILIKITSYARI